MRVFQVAKYYKPLNSAQAFQAEKLTKALKSSGLNVVSFVGERQGMSVDLEEDIVSVPYSDTFFNSTVFRKVNRGLKEFNQLNSANKWVLNTTNKIVELYKPDKNDVILTQSTPFDTHFVGSKIKKDHKTKWIAAFSDPFPISIAPEPYRGANHIPFISTVQKNKLKKVLELADHILVSSFYAYSLMCEFCNIKVQDKYSVIPHIGLNVKVDNNENDTDGWLIHTGNLTKERITDEFFKAVKEVAISNKSFKGVKFIGRASNILTKKIQDYQLENYIKLQEEIPQSEIHQEVKKCSGLVAIEANMTVSPFLPSKFADYATLAKPIICLTPHESEMRNYLNKFGGGIVCNFDSKEISLAIENVITGKCKTSEKLRNHFTSHNVGVIYDKIINQIQ